ncbi:MAG: GAF domain-containing protein [Candidatus Wildermuthbacteria bacterium]|nr:GAF domain-containing protein [Candidatus Wildermuthbacteria bacterium]
MPVAKKSKSVLAALERIAFHLRFRGKLEDLLNDLTPFIGEAFGAKSVAIWLASEDGKYLRIASYFNLTPQFVQFFAQPEHWPRPGQGVVGRSFGERRMYVKHDLLNRPEVPETWKNLLRKKYIEATTLVSHPLFVQKDKPVGIVNLYFAEKKTFTSQERTTLSIIAYQLGVSIEGQSMYSSLRENRDELVHERDQLAHLHQAVQSLRISVEKNLSEILDELSATLGKAVGASGTAIWKVAEKDPDSFHIFMASGMSKVYVDYFKGHPVQISSLGRSSPVVLAALTKKPAFVNNFWDPETIKRFPQGILDAISKERIATVASFPLFDKDELFGVLNFYFAKVHTYSPTERYILQVAANTVSIAIENTEYREELQGTQKALLNILEDVDESRQRAEEERNKTQLIIAHFADGLMVFNEQGQVELVNPRAEQMLRLSKERLLHKSTEELRSFPQLNSLLALLKEKPESGYRKEFELWKNTFIEVSIILLKERGGGEGTLLVVHDITREKQIERLKTEFVSLAAHQLRTPLSAIKWTLRMLLDGDLGSLNPEQREFMDKTYQSNERMIALINDLLDVTRIEEGRYLYAPGLASIEKVIESVLELYKEEARRRNVELVFQRPKEQLPQALVDTGKIQLAIDNLIDNALRYSSAQGKVVVSIAQVGEEIRVSIQDAGVGIPGEEQKRVFQKFFRASNARTIDTEGSGLGLYLVKNIIEAHKGRVEFASEEGKGTTFFLTIPLAKS